MGDRRRPRYLLSGLLTCGYCGGGMSVLSATHIGCSRARNKGTCTNRRTIARSEIETRVLGALGQRLMDPDLFAVFCEEFTAETNRLRAAARGAVDAHQRELAKTCRDLDRLVEAILDGVPAAAVKERISVLEARKAELETIMSGDETPPPVLHPCMAEIYRAKVADLARALGAEDTKAAAVEILRGLIEAIVLTPGDDGYAVTLKGDLAGILTISGGRNDETAAALGPAAVTQVSLVAGAGFEPATFRL